MADGPAVNHFFERTRSAKKIIVIDFGFLGDSVHLVPALWEIKRHYPQAQLHTLSATVGAEVLKLAPCVDQARPFSLPADSPPWWQNFGVLSNLRRERYDVAFNFSGADRTIFVSAFLGAKNTLARESVRKHSWARWLPVDWVERTNLDQPMFEQRRRVLAVGGFSLEPARFDLNVPADARTWARADVPANAVHLSINASSPVKEWPLKNWIEFVKLFSEKYPGIPLVATASANPRERERLHKLTDIVRSNHLQAFEGLPIPKLAALLQRCQLHIGADSGVLHLAAALGVPTLAIFRQYPALAEWLPSGPQHRHLAARCRCIDENRSDCLTAGQSACLGSITAAQILEKACQQMH